MKSATGASRRENQGAVVLFADGSVTTLAPGTSETLKALLTNAGGENVLFALRQADLRREVSAPVLEY